MTLTLRRSTRRAPLGLATLADVLERDGEPVPRATLDTWRRRGILPPPDGVGDNGRPWWNRSTIRAWVAERNREGNGT